MEKGVTSEVRKCVSSEVREGVTNEVGKGVESEVRKGVTNEVGAEFTSEVEEVDRLGSLFVEILEDCKVRWLNIIEVSQWLGVF